VAEERAMADTFNSVHIASNEAAAIDEAEEHAAHSDKVSPRGLNDKQNARVFPAGSVDDLYQVFQKLRRENAELDYLDFHAHGYAGQVELIEDLHLKISDLDRFRDQGFESIFRAGAVISFLSCSLANVQMANSEEDGELFLADFAQIFLHGRGGKAVAWRTPVYYKPSFLLFAPTYQHDDKEIVAEVAPRAAIATLKGQHRLDKTRVLQELIILQVFLLACLPDTYLSPQVCYPVAKNQLEELVARQRASAENARAIKNLNNRSTLMRSLDRVNATFSNLRALASPRLLYPRLHDANQVIQDISDNLVTSGIPVASLLQPIQEKIRAVPIDN
jgi:hypothetical protein